MVFQDNEEDTMPTLLTTEAAIGIDRPPWLPDDAQLAAAAFLARCSGRTLEAYRHDLRYYFHHHRIRERHDLGLSDPRCNWSGLKR